MHVGETALIKIHHRFAYGETGKPPDIPPNTTLLCEVTLKSVEVVDMEVGDLPIQDRIRYGECLIALNSLSLLETRISRGNSSLD